MIILPPKRMTAGSNPPSPGRSLQSRRSSPNLSSIASAAVQLAVDPNRLDVANRY